MLEIEKDRCQKKSRKCLPVRNASSCTEWAVPGLNRGPIDFQSLELNSQHPDNTTLAPPPAVGRSAGRSDDESEGGQRRSGLVAPPGRVADTARTDTPRHARHPRSRNVMATGRKHPPYPPHPPLQVSGGVLLEPLKAAIRAMIASATRSLDGK